MAQEDTQQEGMHRGGTQQEDTLAGDTLHVEGTLEEDILVAEEGTVQEGIHREPRALQLHVLGG